MKKVELKTQRTTSSSKRQRNSYLHHHQRDPNKQVLMVTHFHKCLHNLNDGVDLEELELDHLHINQYHKRSMRQKLLALKKQLKENIGSLTTLVEQQTRLINTLMGNQKHDQPEEDAEVNIDEDMNSHSKASMQGQIDSISKIVEKQNILITDFLNKQGNHQQKELDNEDEDEESDEGSDEDEEEGDQEKLGSQKENVKSNETPSTTPQSHNGSSSHLVKGKCKLFNWQNSKELVAMGKLSTDDPNEVVHGKPLGEGVSRVWVEMAYQPKAPLFRPCFGNEVIEDVIGSTTDWPAVDIMMVD